MKKKKKSNTQQRNTCGIVTNELDCDIEIRNLELQPNAYDHFRNNIFVKLTGKLILQLCVNNTTIDSLEKCLWNYITHKCRYTIKPTKA